MWLEKGAAFAVPHEQLQLKSLSGIRRKTTRRMPEHRFRRIRALERHPAEPATFTDL
jgi:hypothetical protein